MVTVRPTTTPTYRDNGSLGTILEVPDSPPQPSKPELRVGVDSVTV
jgi:hypothetical protein